MRIPLGLSDFRALRQDGYRYVDKTAFVDAVVGADAQVMLVPRPRRFGKTLNLSMLRCSRPCCAATHPSSSAI